MASDYLTGWVKFWEELLLMLVSDVSTTCVAVIFLLESKDNLWAGYWNIKQDTGNQIPSR